MRRFAVASSVLGAIEKCGCAQNVCESESGPTEKLSKGTPCVATAASLPRFLVELANLGVTVLEPRKMVTPPRHSQLRPRNDQSRECRNETPEQVSRLGRDTDDEIGAGIRQTGQEQRQRGVGRR